MTTKCQMTQEEKALRRLLSKAGKVLSEPTRDFLSEAMSAAYADNLVPNFCHQPYNSWHPAEEQVKAAPEALRLERERIISGSVSRPAPEVYAPDRVFAGPAWERG